MGMGKWGPWGVGCRLIFLGLEGQLHIFLVMGLRGGGVILMSPWTWQKFFEDGKPSELRISGNELRLLQTRSPAELAWSSIASRDKGSLVTDLVSGVTGSANSLGYAGQFSFVAGSCTFEPAAAREVAHPADATLESSASRHYSS